MILQSKLLCKHVDVFGFDYSFGWLQKYSGCHQFWDFLGWKSLCVEVLLHPSTPHNLVLKSTIAQIMLSIKPMDLTVYMNLKLVI